MIAVVCALALVIAIVVDKLDGHSTVAGYLKAKFGRDAGDIASGLAAVAKGVWWVVLLGVGLALTGSGIGAVLGIPLLVWQFAKLEEGEVVS